MECYVVVSKMMNSKDAVGLFLEEADAQKFCEGPLVSNGSVEAVSTEFDITKGMKVYAAHKYDTHFEAQIFQNLFEEKDPAKEVSGDTGVVLPLEAE